MHPQDTTPAKHCTKCDTTKPLSQFAKDKSRRDGHDSYCKTCRKQYYQENREHMIATAKKWNRSNPERFANNVRESKQKRPEETARAKHLLYARNIEKWRAKTRQRQAIARRAEGTHTDADVRRQYTAQKGTCYYCRKKVGDAYHVDHAVPLSRGGSNGPENLVIACPHCNISKSNKMPHEWPQGGRLL